MQERMCKEGIALCRQVLTHPLKAVPSATEPQTSICSVFSEAVLSLCQPISTTSLVKIVSRLKSRAMPTLLGGCEFSQIPLWGLTLCSVSQGFHTLGTLVLDKCE
jgi:hypothetical protein